MQSKELSYVEINTQLSPTATVIWLHGLGADGHDFEPIVPELALPESLPVRFIFPHAPVRSVTLNFGTPMRAWFDIIAIHPKARQDEAGIREAQLAVEMLIQKEHTRGIPFSRIILAGFSQGGSMALYTGLRYPERLGGILALSTYLPLAEQLSKEKSAANQDIPILMLHGTMDSVIPLSLVEPARDFLRAQGYQVNWRNYPMPHSTCEQEIKDVREWLITVLG
jgi:phospholipase/carboxylesterase